MSIGFISSVLTAIITGVFAVLVLLRYQRKKSWHLLAWGIGLVLYSLGSASQAILFSSFNPFVFKLWYWSGALVVAPWLGQGTFFLLGKRSWAMISFWIVLISSIVGGVIVFGSSLDPSIYKASVDLTEQYKEIFTSSGFMRTSRIILVIVLNFYGTILLVGGAIYSLYFFFRKKMPAVRMWGSVSIAIGALLPAMGGVFLLLGNPDYKYLGQFFGGIFLFIGFLLGTRKQKQNIEAKPVAKND